MLRYKYIKYNSIAIGIMLSSGILSSFLSVFPKGVLLAIFIPFLYLIRKSLITGIARSSYNCFSVLVLFFLAFWTYSLVIGGFQYVVISNLIPFIVLGVPFIIAAYYEFDSLIVLKVIVFTSIIGLPTQLKNVNMAEVTYNTDGELLMVISYCVLKMTVSSLLLLFLDKTLLIKCISFFVLLFSFVFLITFGARGAQLSLIASFLLLFIYNNNKQFRFFSYKNMLIILICLLVFYYFVEIILYVKVVLTNYDINSVSIDRLFYALENDKDLSSGRFDVYFLAIKDFFDNPLFGNGVGSFNSYSGAYPHNFVLQLLQEGGVLFGLPIIVVIIHAFFMLNSKICKENRFLLIFLICSGLIHLLLSSFYWSSSYFWFLFGLALKDINRKVKLQCVNIS